MNEVELWKKLDVAIVHLADIAKSLRTIADTSAAMRECIDADRGSIGTRTS